MTWVASSRNTSTVRYKDYSSSCYEYISASASSAFCGYGPPNQSLDDASGENLQDTNFEMRARRMGLGCVRQIRDYELHALDQATNFLIIPQVAP